jgi:putative membrane protein
MDERLEAATESGKRTRLAYERTRVASERTLMAWTRTAVSLVGFGFSIPKLFRYLQQDTGQLHRASTSGAANLGLMLIALGTLSLAAGTIQHVLLLRRIKLRPHGRPELRSVSLPTAVCMIAFGVYAYANILLTRR